LYALAEDVCCLGRLDRSQELWLEEGQLNRLHWRKTECCSDTLSVNDWDVLSMSLAGPLAQLLLRAQIGMLWGYGLAKSPALARFRMLFSYALYIDWGVL